MKISSSGIVNGHFLDKFGKRGEQFSDNGMPNYSFPLEISDAPAGTVSYVIVVEDKDAVPVCGHSWIHWLAANVVRTSLPENDSVNSNDYVQGVNSWGGALYKFEAKEASFYGGMAPPDKTHRYETHVYALDCMLDLKPGFYFNELHFAMQGHILDSATLIGSYDS